MKLQTARGPLDPPYNSRCAVFTPHRLTIHKIDTRHSISHSHRLHPLKVESLSTMLSTLKVSISNDLFFALKLEPISNFPGMNHLLLARDAGMRLERP